MLLKVVYCWLILLIVLLAACAPAAQDTVNTGSPDQLYIVTSTGMLGDALRAVGGTHVYVAQLMAANTDPHRYVSSGRDQLALQKAKLVVYNGLGLESGLLPPTTATPSPSVFLAAEVIPADQRIMVGGVPDPHVWMDVSLWETVVTAIRDQLTALDAAHAADYQANAQTYLTQLQELDQYIHEQVNRLPPDHRLLITLHQAFNYFGRAYGLQTAALKGLTTDMVASDEAMQLIADDLPSVFTENSTLPDDINTLVAKLQSQGQVITVAGSLYTESLGQPESEGSTYIGMMRYNVDNIVTGLLGLPAE